MSRQILRVWPSFIAALLVGGFLGALHLWPASYWMDVHSVHIDSGPDSAKLAMVVQRNIKRNFSAIWIVTIRQWDGDWVAVCSASGSGTYVEGGKFPKTLNLNWWTDKQCHPLLHGKYQATTTWTIGTLGLMPDKQISIESNVFEVTP
jgi:hypothetical protein